MSYKLWNEAFVKYFFTDNKDEEIILYVDEKIINEIGERNELGNIENFLKSLIACNDDERKTIYSNVFGEIRNGDVEFNRNVRAGSVFDFANFIRNGGKTELPILNYVILAIYAKTSIDESDRSYYSNLNRIISNIDPKHKKVSSNNINLDNLFDTTKIYDNRFQNNQIGSLRFMGLLKYQVVLTPKEKYSFEETLFKNKIEITENTDYHQFANRFLSVLPNANNKLREKIKLGGKDPVYAQWFLNRVLKFNPNSFSKVNPDVKQGKEIGEIALCFNPNEKYLYLTINTASTEEISIGYYVFSLKEKESDGFSSNPVIVNSKIEVDFEQYKTIENENCKFSFLPINGVTFLQKNRKGHFQQITNTLANTPTLIIVKNKKQEIDKWEKWKIKYTNNCSQQIPIVNTENIFTRDYIVYEAESISKEYYTRNVQVTLKDYAKELYVKKIGGYKLAGVNTYFDVALPSFKIENSIENFEDFKVKIETNDRRDSDIEVKISDPFIKLFLGNDKVILEEQKITVKITLNNLEKKFSFIVIPSKLKNTSTNELFRLNQWGVKADNENVYYNGKILKGSSLCELSGNRHSLGNLIENSTLDNNYFIYLLSALSDKKDSSTLSYQDITNAIKKTTEYFDINNINYLYDQYSNSNIIRNLIALGLINKQRIGNETVFQVTPPSLVRIEKTFTTGGQQVYKLVGSRSRRLDQVLKEFCNKEGVEIKYLAFNEDTVLPIELVILPSMCFINSNINTEELKKIMEKELDIELHIEKSLNIGDSLLNFIASVSDFKETFLKLPTDSYSNQIFDEDNSLGLPRIIKSKELYLQRGNLIKKKYLRISDDNQTGIFSENQILMHWARLYVEYKHQNVVLFVQVSRYNYANFTSEILIPKIFQIPSVLYKALSEINHGIPVTQKCFIYKTSDNISIDKKRFILFDKYHIGDKPVRRNNIFRILTGKSNIADNKQIVLYTDKESDIKMKFVVCSTFNKIKNLVLFYNSENKIIAFCSNYMNVYIVCENGNQASINSENLLVKKVVKNDNTINEIFSQIIDGDLDKLSTVSIDEGELSIEISEISETENIRILELKEI